MRYKYGNSVCISTQVGCRMGCKFCASTLAGLVRSLTPAEMLDEIYTLTRESGQRVSNVVLMGIGEPLDNFENVMKFMRILSSPPHFIGSRCLLLGLCRNFLFCFPAFFSFIRGIYTDKSNHSRYQTRDSSYILLFSHLAYLHHHFVLWSLMIVWTAHAVFIQHSCDHK